MQNIISEVDKQRPTPTHDKCFFLKIHENWIFIENYSIVKIPVEMWMHTLDVMPSRRCLEKMKKILFKIVWQIVGKGRKVNKSIESKIRLIIGWHSSNTVSVVDQKVYQPEPLKPNRSSQRKIDPQSHVQVYSRC